MDRFFVVTGGPGAGKSSLIQFLQSRGYNGIPEAGRAIIKDQSEIGGKGLPAVDAELFGEILLSWHLRAYREASAMRGTVFFDRGVVDTVAYYRSMGLAVPRYVHTAVSRFPYNRTVFVAPPWAEIYRTDSERTEDFDQSVAVYQFQLEAYRSAGYELIRLPLESVADRAASVIRMVSDRTYAESQDQGSTL